jgi:hypothetical protein
VALPQVADFALVHQLNEINNQKINIENKYKLLKKNFKENLNNPKANLHWSMKRNLWIWFLTEPAKVMKAKQEIEKAAMKMTKTKGHLGINCKADG